MRSLSAGMPPGGWRLRFNVKRDLGTGIIVAQGPGASWMVLRGRTAFATAARSGPGAGTGQAAVTARSVRWALTFRICRRRDFRNPPANR